MSFLTKFCMQYWESDGRECSKSKSRTMTEINLNLETATYFLKLSKKNLLLTGLSVVSTFIVFVLNAKKRIPILYA